MKRDLRAGAHGFTLIETLIALVVAATAAAAILSQLRGLVARVEQERAHELAVLQLLNESARLSFGSPGGERIETVDEERLRIIYADPARPVVTVRNFSARNQRIPPVALAYTPFQVYTLSERNHEFSLLAPGIRRADTIMPKKSAVGAGGVPEKGAPAPKPSLSPVLP